MGQGRIAMKDAMGWLGRQPPVVQIAIVTAVPMLMLLVLLLVVEPEVETRSAIAQHESRTVARVGPLRPSDVGGVQERLSREDGRTLIRRLGPLGAESSVILRNRHGRVLFSGGRDLARSPDKAAERAALRTVARGRVASVAIPGGSDEDGIATFIPLRATSDGKPQATLELVHPRDAAIAQNAPQSGHLMLVLSGAVLCWALLVGVLTLLQRSPRHALPEPTTGDANSDPLTGLPNRAAYRALLERAIESTKRGKGVVAAILMDLDRFKEINDTLGHYNGDLLLKRIGPRLRAVLRDEDTIARLGGDEFAILLPDLPTTEAATAAAERISGAFEEPFVLGGLALSVESSVGVAIAPEHGTRVDALLHRADTAMYAAKTKHLGYAIYSDEQEQGSRRRLALAGELRTAIAEDQIAVYYQPKARVDTGAVTGVEALARWLHPSRGVISPGEFIPIAEQTNQLHALTERVLDRALDQLNQWRRNGFELTVAVNLSMRNLLDVNLPDDVQKMLTRWKVDPTLLELELTESMIMSDPRRVKSVIGRLKEVGVRLSVDDFGTGYSSLAYLKDLAVDAIKVDRSFVMDMDDDARNRAIVRSTIDLGRNLGLEVIAEGVETAETFSELGRMGCNYAQGYLLARPLPAPDLAGRLRELEREGVAGMPPANSYGESVAGPTRATAIEESDALGALSSTNGSV